MSKSASQIGIVAGVVDEDVRGQSRSVSVPIASGRKIAASGPVSLPRTGRKSLEPGAEN